MTLLLALLLALLARLQAPPAPTDPSMAILEHLRAGRYLAALEAAEHALAGGEDPLLLDLHGLVQSFVGLEEEAALTFDALQGTKSAPLAAPSPLDSATALDAIPAIVEAARGRRIVILNESHHMPRHRAFALELARALRAEGFDTFAAETFQDVEGTARRGYPTASTGFYTADPVFGELVRAVLALGYRPVAYEWMPSAESHALDPLARIALRETAQAENLVARVFVPHPEARLFVYVGYSHATEDWVDPGGPNERAWMAARLSDLTGHDPLTIDQTIAMPRSAPEFEDPHWRRAEERGWLDGPKVFRLADRRAFVTGEYAGKVDLQVFHPRARSVHGRPDWLARGRASVAVPDALRAAIPEDERVLLQAFRAGEEAGAIPSDQFVAEGRADPRRFLLPAGEYRLVVQDAAGGERGSAPLRVE